MSQSIGFLHSKHRAYILAGAQYDVPYLLLVATVGQRTLDHKTMAGSRRPACLGWNIGNAYHHNLWLKSREFTLELSAKIGDLINDLSLGRLDLTGLHERRFLSPPFEDDEADYRLARRWKPNAHSQHQHDQHYRVLAMSGLPAAQTGDRIDGRYRVLGRLGGGSYGEVFRVADDHLGNEVALKLLTPKQNEPATWDEAQVLERLRSPYLLRVLNADLVDDTDIRYITTPVITGGDLEDVADGFGVDPASAVRWGEHLGYGLDRMHREGLLHRDVKPGNAYLDDNGDVLLGDLGMAAAMDADGKASATGSYATVAPEVVSPEDPGCSIATDIYSLAATVFYLLTGHYPTGSRSMGNGERKQKILSGKFLDLRSIAPHVSLSVARAVGQGLSLDPAQRPKSAQDFANQLASCSHHPRPWRRIDPHPGHEACFLGSATKTALGVEVCVIPESSGKFAIQVQLSTGRRRTRHEKQGLTPPQLLVALRRIAKDV